MALPNLFLLVNLGCEMLYIIDQRLVAQSVAKDKSAQGRTFSTFKTDGIYINILVLREVTSALLSQQFFQYMSANFSEDLISIAQVRLLLSDIACCSLMRLDSQSLDKLLDLMIMVIDT